MYCVSPMFRRARAHAQRSLHWLPASLAAVLLLASQMAMGSTALDQLDRFVQGVETFQADFEQTLYDADSQPLQTTTGSIRLKRPGRFVWSYDGADSQEIVADGERIWLYDKGLDQVTVNAINERIAGTPLVLLMRSAPLEESFDIVELGEAEGINWLELTPISENSDFEMVFLGMNDAGLAAMELRDNFGQATQIRFSDFEADVELDDSLFVFEVPEGVDVIGLDDN
ncbi:outer membrane lipoprotein chaperone LolA [Granulosicoccus sp. 3-233]|uniref:outer membrane lipoprotein chaperone LolA n=1 Tax=Granulosicoccus sp. 3-233 TaxID=3417969 RepID=UPI003D34C523